MDSAGGASVTFARTFALGHRQLQHGRALAFAKLRHQHMASVRKFDRVMVAIGHFGFDLVELADPPVGGSRPDPAVVVSDVLGERQFGAGKHADRHGGLAFRRKAAGRCTAECRGDQRLADLGGPRRHSMQAIVTHRMAPSFEIADPCLEGGTGLYQSGHIQS